MKKITQRSTLAVAVGFGVTLIAAWAQTAAPQSTFEVKKLPATAPTGPPAFPIVDRGPSTTAPHTQADHATFTADMIKKLGVKLLAEAPYRVSLALTHPHAGFYAKNCGASSGFDSPSYVSMWKPTPTGAPMEWNNSSWVVATQETILGYAYTLDFELRNFTQGPPGPIPFKVLVCNFNTNTGQLYPMYQGVLVSYPNNHLVVGFQAGFNGHVGVVIQPAVAGKGVNSVLITPHKLQ